MFKLENEMTAPARLWMESLGFCVRAEFISLYGKCDLVGLIFDDAKVEHRLALRQKQAVNSLARSALLLKIPDIETHAAISRADLVELCAGVIPADKVDRELNRLVCGRFVQQTPEGQLQKANGWAPLHRRLIAVELKLHRFEEALGQATSNLAFADESYVGFPAALAQRIAGDEKRLSRIRERGLGLLAVSATGCEVILTSEGCPHSLNPVLQFYCAEKFWAQRNLKAAKHQRLGH